MSDPIRRVRRVLLDEMLPKMLARELPGQSVSTVAKEGWAGIVNGELLGRCESAGFDVFVTADQNMEHQQRLGGRSFGVVVLAVGGTKPEDIRNAASALQDAVDQVKAGEIRHVFAPDP